jgi:hypothetical protein
LLYSSDVREAAAIAFNKLQHVVGIRAVDEILPSLLVELGCGDSVRSNLATHGLRGILASRSREVSAELAALTVAEGCVHDCWLLLPSSTLHHCCRRLVLQVLPTVIPKLVAVPISPANARALAAVVDVTSSTIQSQFNVRDVY